MTVPPTVVEAGSEAWTNSFEDLFSQVVAPFFGRREPRLRARYYLLGLLSGLERKNGWSLAEFASDATPDGMQRLLNHARWDADEVRNALRAQVGERLGHLDGVLVVDDTGFEKKGRRSAGRAGAARKRTASPHRGPESWGRSPREGPGGDDPGELIGLTVNEIRRLHAHYHRPDHAWSYRVRWSRWRHRHQARARCCHYQRQKRLIDH
ncbi:transposase [Nocardiopsis sp. MT53]|uniref:Transposase n=1 Tax=Nocardiopsis changdeensis TaxID=2831969 RepID=A0ABX8BNM5_9ACTN|nr:transposase [Nocardiopsis changdeensis]QYX38418.1 transposase [Nocardiopsis sp. MT53]